MEHSIVLLFSVTVALLISAVCAVHLHLTKYNEAEAKVLVNLAAAAYSNMPETCVNNTLPSDDHWYMVNEANTVCDTHESSCAGYTLRSDKLRQIIVVFRGTKTKKQLLLEGWKSLKPGHDFFGVGKVNRYFFHALDAIWPNVLPTLKDPNFKSYAVTFTGHSLGGALAALAAIRTVLEDLRRSDEIKLITFGEPRVGDKSFSNKFDELVPYSFRVVHRADIVPHLPACRKGEDETPDDDDDSRPCLGDGLGKAYHHGTEIWYPDGMYDGAEYVECLGTPKDEDFNCSDRLTFELSEYDGYIWDHRNYFSHRVPRFGKLGCVEIPEKTDEKVAAVQSTGSLGASAPSQEKPKKSLLTKTVSGVLHGLHGIAHVLGLDKKL